MTMDEADQHSQQRPTSVVVSQQNDFAHVYSGVVKRWNVLASDKGGFTKPVGVAAVLLLAFLVIDLIEDDALEKWTTIIPQLTSLSQLMIGGVIQTISGLGYYGIFALMLLASISLPIPSEMILPFSGYLVSRGILHF